MKKIIAGIVTLFFLATSIATIQAQKNLVPFDKLIITGNVSVQLIEGELGGINIQNDKEHLEYGVEGQTLKISAKNLIKYKQVPTIKVLVTYNKLRSIKARAGAAVYTDNTIEADVLSLRFSSGATGELTINTNTVEIGVSEGGNLSLDGTTHFQDIKAVTGGNLSAYQFESQQAVIKANTGGSAKLTAYESIDAVAKTGGMIRYKGDPNKVRAKDGLSGSIKALD